MELQLKGLLSDAYQRNFVAASKEDTEKLYLHNQAFWSTRNSGSIPDEAKQMILAQQSFDDTFFSHGFTDRLVRIVSEYPGDAQPSILEIGAANGTLLRRLESRGVTRDVAYTGFECLPLLCDDFVQNFPGQRIVCGDVDDFLRHDFDAEAVPFSLFCCSVTFIMIEPNRVRAAIRKIASLADEFLLFDFIETPDLPLEADENMLVYLPNRKVFWFMHDFRAYLDDAGFDIVESEAPVPGDGDLEPTSPYQQYRGMGYIHARRR